MTLRRLAFVSAAVLALSSVFATGALARPPGGPGWHHPAPPPRHHHHSSAWLWAPAIAGLTFWGLSELADDRYDRYHRYDYYVPYRYRVAPSYPAPSYVVPDYRANSAAYSAEQSARRAEAAANAAVNAANSVKTLYWCESEQGFYPQVRACPTGWTPIASP